MNTNIEATISNKTASFIQENISLKDKSWFQTGGIARFYCAPITTKEFRSALEFAKKK